MCANHRFVRPFQRLLFLMTFLILAWQPPVSAKEPNREEVLSEIQGLSSLELIVSYQESQMMLQFAELAEHGIKIETAEGTISKRKAKKISREFQQRIELSEQVMDDRGISNLEGEYKFLVNGDCERAHAWWAAMGGNDRYCGDLRIRQEGMNINVVQPCEHESDKFDLENSGITVDDAVLIVEEVNSDYRYVGTIHDGVISLRVDADRVLASWPDFQKPPSKKAIESCLITLEPK
jgi:hypothetical protein